MYTYDSSKNVDSCSLWDLTQHLTTRADDNHAPSVSVFLKTEENEARFASRDTLQSLVQSIVSCKDSLRSKKQSILSIENSNEISFDSTNSVEESGAMTKKRRISWTQDLHKRFIECVDRLGGAKKATPKGILKLMNHDGLTIFHVKSHLQKYRVTKGISEAIEGETCTLSTPSLHPEMDLQIVEALRLQLDVQQRLYEQLESQRILQLRIEKQAKELREMFDRQMGTKTQ